MKTVYSYVDVDGDKIQIDADGEDIYVLIRQSDPDKAVNVLIPGEEARRMLAAISNHGALKEEAAALLRAMAHSREVSMTVAVLREVHDWAKRWDAALASDGQKGGR